MKPLNLTDQHLMEVKFSGIREHLAKRVQEANEAGLAHDEFLNLCLYDEIEHRKNKKTQRLLKTAEFKCVATPENIDFTTPRGLDKKLIKTLVSTAFIDEGLNIVIFGPTGVGKSHLASAIGHAACRIGKTTIFYRMNTLIEKMLLARAQGKYLSHLKRLAGVDLLILDDFGIKQLSEQQFQDLYDILDERFEHKATIITSQLPIENWIEIIPDPLTREAITDRIISKAIKINMKGGSYRSKKLKNLDSN